MKKTLKIIVLVLAVVFAAAQFYRPDQTKAAIVPSETLEATTQVPENVAAVLKRSCNDCHSNQTVYPWYSNITPVNWLLADHIDEGRRELNFSVWNTYTAQRKIRQLGRIRQQVNDGEMPHYQYLWMHRDAKLSDADKRILFAWTQAEIAKLSGNQ